jgi:hypothetical protein
LHQSAQLHLCAHAPSQRLHGVVVQPRLSQRLFLLRGFGSKRQLALLGSLRERARATACRKSYFQALCNKGTALAGPQKAHKTRGLQPLRSMSAYPLHDPAMQRTLQIVRSRTNKLV